MKRFAFLGAALLLIIAAWSGVWLYFAGEVRKSIEVLALADGVTNPKISCGDLSIHGYPFRFSADCTDASLVQGDIVVAIPRIRATALAYRYTLINASALGPATITDAFTGSKNTVAWGGLDGSFHFENNRIARISLVGETVVWNDTVMGERLIAQSPKVEAHLLNIPEQFDAANGLGALAAFAQAESINAPGFAINAGTLSFEAEASALPPDPSYLFTDARSLQYWQQSGGKLKLTRIAASDGDASLESAGTLGLDDQGRVEGQLTATSKGLVERLGPVLSEPLRTLVLGNQAADGTYSQTVNLRAGVIFAGMLPAGAIPPLY